MVSQSQTSSQGIIHFCCLLLSYPHHSAGSELQYSHLLKLLKPLLLFSPVSCVFCPASHINLCLDTSVGWYHADYCAHHCRLPFSWRTGLVSLHHMVIFSIPSSCIFIFCLDFWFVLRGAFILIYLFWKTLNPMGGNVHVLSNSQPVSGMWSFRVLLRRHAESLLHLDSSPVIPYYLVSLSMCMSI